MHVWGGCGWGAAGVCVYSAHSSCANLGVCPQICMGSGVHICVFMGICVCSHKRVSGQAGGACSGVIEEKKEKKKSWNLPSLHAVHL